MKNKEYICEVCHEKKTASEMSLSYKHRCKECVAKQTREKRATTKGEQTSIDWEQRRYEIARDMLNGWASHEYGIMN